MVDEMRRQLDALMGTNRDGADPHGGTLKHFSDRDVCKYYLCGLCPHDCFHNTRKELGPCPNLHSEPLKIHYDMEDPEKRKSYGYGRQLGRFLEDMVLDCDRTIERQERKLKENEAEKLENDPISRQIAALQTQAERLGEEGNIDDYAKVNAEIEVLKQKRQEQQVMQIPTGAAGEVILSHGTQSQQQKLRVCEICGCYLSKFDSDKRLADHFSGKLHMGYLAIREKLEELKKEGVMGPSTISESSVMRRSREHVSRDEPYSDRERERRDRERSRDRERERRDLERSHERDRRERDRERERDRRDDRSRRNHERDRERDRRDDRDRRDRNRSRRERSREGDSKHRCAQFSSYH